jgi:hypothetical protein
MIRIEATKWFHPKSEDSLGDVEVDGEVMELFRGYRAKVTGTFVVESKVTPRPEATFEHYRCESHFELTAGCRCSPPVVTAATRRLAISEMLSIWTWSAQLIWSQLPIANVMLYGPSAGDVRNVGATDL